MLARAGSPARLSAQPALPRSPAARALPLATAWADRAAAAVALHSGDTARAIERALASAVRCRKSEPPSRARSRARSRAERSPKPARATGPWPSLRAAAAFDACGALRYRDERRAGAGKLGHRPHRRTHAGNNDGTRIESLTERELQVARLVVDRKTNPRSPRTCSSARRRSRPTCATSSARSTSRHASSSHASSSTPTSAPAQPHAIAIPPRSPNPLRVAWSRNQGAKSGCPPMSPARQAQAAPMP